MFIFFLLFVLIILLSCSLWPVDQWKSGYLSKEQSNCIKGIFAVLIFLGHSVNFIPVSGQIDMIYITIKNHILQAVVVMFLFYSGYGLTESLKKKGLQYIRSIPRKRLLPVYVRFFISVVIYVTINTILGTRLSFQTVILAFAGWVDIGNYGWFILIILLLYIVFMISFGMAFKSYSNKKVYYYGATLTTVLSISLLVLMIYPGCKESWYYDTIILFSSGVWYSIFKDKVDRVFDNKKRYFAGCVILAALYILINFMDKDLFPVYESFYMIFMIAVIMISMRIKIQSRILSFLGSLSFSMILLQGIPFMLLGHTGLNDRHPYLFVILAFSMTTVMSIIFNKCTVFLDPKAKT